VRSGPGKTAKNQKKKKRKKKYSGQQQKEIDRDEPHPAPNEKTQPIQWTERPTGALVAVNSLWPVHWWVLVHCGRIKQGIFLRGFNNSARLPEAKSAWARLEASKTGPLITIVSIGHYYIATIFGLD